MTGEKSTSKNNDPKRTGLVGKLKGHIGRIAGDKNVGLDHPERRFSKDDIVKLQDNIAADSRVLLKDGASRHLISEAMATRRETTGRQEGLSNIIIAGNTVFGIIRAGRQGAIPDTISIGMLPVGVHDELPNGHKATSMTLLATVKLAQLSQVRPEGYVQAWETFKFGRSAKEGIVTSGDDPDMSREHFAVTVGRDGDIEVQDLESSNGTTYFDIHDVSHIAGFNETSHEIAADMIRSFQDNPYRWSADPAFVDQRIVRAQ